MTQAELFFDPARRHSPPGNPEPVCDPRSAAPVALLSVRDVAHVLGCGRTLVYELISSGELETVKLGRLRRVPADALAGLVQRLRAGSVSVASKGR